MLSQNYPTPVTHCTCHYASVTATNITCFIFQGKQDFISHLPITVYVHIPFLINDHFM